MNIHTYLKNVIEKNILLHTGGEAFFNALDAEIRTPMFFQELVRVLPEGSIIVISGKFGHAFRQYLHKTKHTLSSILINGSLRHKEPVKILENKYLISENSLIFIDDSFYSGKTFRAIKQTIELHNGNMNKAIVIYDGSKQKLPYINSFYRYYN